MMITIHGFPAKTKYQDVKLLIKRECNLSDFILDNLVSDADGSKKVRIGLTDDSEGCILMKCLDGYRLPGNFVLKVVPVGKTPANMPPQSSFDSRPGYQNQPRNDYPNASRNDYGNQGSNDYNQGSHGSSGPHGHGGPHMPMHGPGASHGSGGLHGHGGPHGPRSSHGHGGPQGPSGSIDSVNRPSPWASGSNSNQWNPNPQLAPQMPQSSFGFNSQPTNMNSSFGQQHQQQLGHSRPETRPYNQGRAQPEQGFGFTPKSNIPEAQPARPADSRRALRSIETVDTSVSHPPVHERYPPNQPFHQDKPLTIMKDNFQGPTQYNITNPEGRPSGHSSQYSSQTAPSPWQSQSQPTKPQFSKPNPDPYDKPYEDRKYVQPDRDAKTQAIRAEPQERTYKEYEKRRGFSPRRSPHAKRISPERRISPSGRRVSPSGRRISPPGRRISPSGRRISPSGRRISPSGRRISPSGRRMSPHGRKFSPPGKRISPDRRIPGHHPARRESPPKRSSPIRRLVSPPRRPSPGRRDSPPRQGGRYSPERLHPDKMDKYGQDKLKSVRPAYEPTSHASNQAMYSGGYRPNDHESAQYPMQGVRQVEQRNSPWQRDVASMKKLDDDRRDISRMQVGRERIPDTAMEAKRTLTPQRKSRSPIRRDRSPLRDRYKRHSPSPRSSHSPRRSWALEKRRSPEERDAPPPPSWPGQNVGDNAYPGRTNRPNFPERDQGNKGKHIPVWEPHPFEKEDDPRGRRPDNDDRRTFFDDKVRPVKDLPVRNVIPPPSHNERFAARDPKDVPREDYVADRRDNYRRRDDSPDLKPLPNREGYDLMRRPREHDDRPPSDEYHRRREPSPRHSNIRKEELIHPNVDKDFEDIYKRAQQFKKKAEELRKLGSQKRDDYLEDERSRSQHTEREREPRFEARHRFREEEPLWPREREDRSRDDRPHHDPHPDAHRRDYHSREEYQKQIERDREDDRLKRFTMSPSIRIKREKAIEEIANKIIDRHENYKQLKGEQRMRVLEELKIAVARIVYDMFGDNDVSFIEIIIKYQAKYTIKDEVKILQDVMASLPSQFRTIKRHVPDQAEVPAKTVRRSQSPNFKPERAPRPKLSESRWSMNIVPPEVVTVPILGVPPTIPPVMNQGMLPMMVPAPFINPYEGLQQSQAYVPEKIQFQQSFPESSSNDEYYKIYFCKDDFDQITNGQADLLKDFLIGQMVKETEVSQGWAPDFTLKGLQSANRYEVITKDDSSRDWLVNLDFSEFHYFNVLVYTKDEMWYERAAVWLPGHSRSRNIEPLEKLKLQNKKLEGVNVNKWKFVKKIVNQKGTRLYVDIPPSSARALERHKMMLSYELQKVNVFLKAVAVDKDAFDAGLKEPSVLDPAEIATAIQNSPMPSLAYEHSLVKITLNGCKTLTLMQARKIKEVLIYNLFRYHQQEGSSKTDFMKYGFFPPNYFGIVPQNQESKRWLLGRHLGKVNRQAIVVLGGEEENTRFFKMFVTVPNEYQINAAIVAERLKQSNQGVKGINFNIWKPIKIVPDRKKAKFEVDVDLESLETLSKMNYQLDYVDHENTSHTAYFKSEYPEDKLEEIILKCKAEMTDSYDVANMDLDSDDTDDDIICLD